MHVLVGQAELGLCIAALAAIIAGTADGDCAAAPPVPVKVKQHFPTPQRDPPELCGEAPISQPRLGSCLTLPCAGAARRRGHGVLAASHMSGRQALPDIMCLSSIHMKQRTLTAECN